MYMLYTSVGVFMLCTSVRSLAGRHEDKRVYRRENSRIACHPENCLGAVS